MLHKQRQRMKKQYSLVRSFMDSEKVKEKHAEETLLKSISNMVSEWTKTRKERLEKSMEDFQSSIKDNAHFIDKFQGDFSDMVDSTIKNNTNRLTEVQTAQDTILEQLDMFQDVSNSNR